MVHSKTRRLRHDMVSINATWKKAKWRTEINLLKMSGDNHVGVNPLVIFGRSLNDAYSNERTYGIGACTIIVECRGVKPDVLDIVG